MGYCILFVGCHILCECFICAMWDVASTAWAIVSSMQAVTAYLRSAQALCGLFRPLCGMFQPLCGMFQPLCGMFQPLCGLSLANTGNEDIAFCCGYHTFAKIPRACPSLTTPAYLGLRFNHRWSLPTTVAGNKEREPRQGKMCLQQKNT